MKWILVIGSIIVVYVLFAPFVKAQDVTGEVEMRASMRNMVCAKDFDFAHRDVTEIHGEEVIWEGAVVDFSYSFKCTVTVIHIFMQSNKGIHVTSIIYGCTDRSM